MTHAEIRVWLEGMFEWNWDPSRAPTDAEVALLAGWIHDKFCKHGSGPSQRVTLNPNQFGALIRAIEGRLQG